MLTNQTNKDNKMNYFHFPHLPGSANLSILNLKRKWLLALTLFATVIIGVIAPERICADDYPMVLTIVNNSGFDDTNVYLLCTGSNQTGPDADEHFGYLDFANNSFHEIGPKSEFSLNVSTMTKTLNEFKNNNTYTINIPKMVSGRLYFAFGDNFDMCPSFSASGPPNGTTNTVVYDKVEFDTWINPNINTTNVDFFGISYYVTATEASTKDQVERGYLKSRDAVFAAFENIAGNDYQLYGNTGIFEALSLTRTIKDGVDKVRVLAPKNAAFKDFNSSLTFVQQKSSHFFDQYVNNQCWKPNRKFSFYSKLFKPSDPHSDMTIYYGQVSADGRTLHIYTDKDRTHHYQPVPTLPRPSSGNILFPEHLSQWHQVNNTSSDEIDWGFLLGGQAGGPDQTAGAYWTSDPVAMAITISIVRGVMHYDEGCEKWTDSNNYYPGDNGIGSAEYPIYYYGKLIHDQSIENKSYALSYDDIYGADPSIYFKGHPNVTLTFNHVKPYSQAKLLVSEENLWVETESGSTTINVSNAGTVDTTMAWTSEVKSGGSWLHITSGASGNNDGTIFCAFDKNMGEVREGVIRITADEAIGTPVDVTVTQAPKVTACTATIDGTLLLHIPYLSYSDPNSGTQTLWAKFDYAFNPMYPALIIYKLNRFDIKNDPFSCAASTLSYDSKIHIPDVLLPDGTTHLWVDLEFIPALSIDDNIYFVVSNFG